MQVIYYQLFLHTQLVQKHPIYAPEGASGYAAEDSTNYCRSSVDSQKSIKFSYTTLYQKICQSVIDKFFYALC